jgi:hypothetical protein
MSEDEVACRHVRNPRPLGEPQPVIASYVPAFSRASMQVLRLFGRSPAYSQAAKGGAPGTVFSELEMTNPFQTDVLQKQLATLMYPPNAPHLTLEMWRSAL